jgi:hypothetical protein
VRVAYGGNGGGGAGGDDDDVPTADRTDSGGDAARKNATIGSTRLANVKATGGVETGRAGTVPAADTAATSGGAVPTRSTS